MYALRAVSNLQVVNLEDPALDALFDEVCYVAAHSINVVCACHLHCQIMTSMPTRL
jgi:hypothetical protein